MILSKLHNLLRNTIGKVIGSSEYTKFVIITRSRTGSNFLLTLLNSHKNILVYGEIFSKIGDKDCNFLFKKIYPNKSLSKYIGFKIFYYHPLDSKDKSIWDKLSEDSTIKIIHLQRKNFLRVHVSRLIAGKTDIWSEKTEHRVSLNDKKVYIDIDEVIDDFETTSKQIKRTKDLFKHHEVLDVFYENLVNNKKKEIRRILRFLGASQMTLRSKLKKQNPERLKSLISNYEEVHHKITNTEYSFWLEE